MAARGLGPLAAAFWLLALLASGLGAVLSEEPPEAPALGAVLTGLVVAASVGVGTGWWRERFGGTVLLVSAVGLAVFALRHRWPQQAVRGGGLGWPVPLRCDPLSGKLCHLFTHH